MVDPHTSSWALVRHAAAGSPQHRERFAIRYDPVVRAYFAARWRLPPQHERVHDAAQEVFLLCFKHNGVLDKADPHLGSAFKSFLYGVARRVGANLDRQSGQRREVGADSALDLQAAPSEAALSTSFDRAWARLVAREAGDLARSRSRGDPTRVAGLEALQLRFFEGLQPREIADRRGVSVESIYESLRQAKRDFRAAILEVMAAYNPHCNEAELRAKCVELVTYL